MASVTCGNCKRTHASVRAVRLCYDTAKAIWQIPAAPGFMVEGYPEYRVLSMDEAVALMEDLEAQALGEIWAENAWLRAAENSGEPDFNPFTGRWE